jgi:hypothetical protein
MAGEADAEVDLAAGDHLWGAEASGRAHIPDIGEAVRAQERFSHIKRGEADGRRKRKRMVVVSSGAPSASASRAPRAPAAAANEALARNCRRD